MWNKTKSDKLMTIIQIEYDTRCDTLRKSLLRIQDTRFIWIILK